MTKDMEITKAKPIISIDSAVLFAKEIVEMNDDETFTYGTKPYGVAQVFLYVVEEMENTRSEILQVVSTFAEMKASGDELMNTITAAETLIKHLQNENIELRGKLADAKYAPEQEEVAQLRKQLSNLKEWAKHVRPILGAIEHDPDNIEDKFRGYMAYMAYTHTPDDLGPALQTIATDKVK